MTEFLYIIKIVAYFAFIFSIYFVTKKSKDRKIPIWIMLLFSLIFGLYAIWSAKYPYVSDRLNYAFRFEDQTGLYDYFVKWESTGLYVLEQILHLFTYDAKALFFTVAFLFMFIMLLAYRKSKNSTPLSFLFLMLTIFPTYGLFSIKQAMAMALLSLGYAIYTKENKTKKDFIESILCLVFAILFHETAWLVLPVFLVLKLAKNRYIKRVFFAGIVLVTIFFRQLSPAIVSVVGTLVPSLKSQLTAYLDSSGAIAESGSGMITALKGVPFYYVLFAGFKNRNEIKSTFKEYDSYLLLTMIVSATIVLSGFMYWMFRFGLLFYMPVCDFAFIVYRGIVNKKEKAVFVLFTIIIAFVLSFRMMAQYYFLYGGI